VGELIFQELKMFGNMVVDRGQAKLKKIVIETQFQYQKAYKLIHNYKIHLNPS
jgi:hypothetical protein